MLRVACVPIALLALLAASGAAAGPARVPAHTVVTTRRIARFAQDGSWVAWTSSGKACSARVHLYSLRRHAQAASAAITSPYGCGTLYGQLALAGDRAEWTSLVGAGNTELDVDVSTLSARAPQPHRVREMAMIRDDQGPDPLPPPLAGRGATLVYYRHEDGIIAPTTHAVERIVGGRPRRLFAVEDPIALAVDRNRVAAVRQFIDAGDACHCNTDPAWSPDGTKIAFISGDVCCGDFGGPGPSDIYVMNADGSGRTRITTDGHPKAGVAWSPDGTRLAYGAATPQAALMVANADGSGAHQIAVGVNPTWSPDGTQVAYESNLDVDVVNADGTNVHALAFGGRQPAWSPDGSKIAYTDEKGSVDTIKPDGDGNQVLVTHAASAAWSPDGTVLAVQGDAGLRIVRADGTGSHPVFDTHRGDTDPTWSRDGTQIAFDSAQDDLTGTGRPDIYVADALRGGVRPLTFKTFDQWGTAWDVWNPNGSMFPGDEMKGAPLAVALDGSYAAVLTEAAYTNAKAISIGRVNWGVTLRTVPVPAATATFLSASGGRAVYLAGRTIYTLTLATGATKPVAAVRGAVAGLAISGLNVYWAENVGTHGLIRTVHLHP